MVSLWLQICNIEFQFNMYSLFPQLHVSVLLSFVLGPAILGKIINFYPT